MGQTGEHAPQSPDFKVDPNSIGGRAIAWLRRYRANKMAERTAERQAKPAPLFVGRINPDGTKTGWKDLSPAEREAEWQRFDRLAETVIGMPGRMGVITRAGAGLAGQLDLRHTKWFSDLAETYGTRDANEAARLISSPEFKDFFWQGDPSKVVRDARTYRGVRDIINRLGGDPTMGRGVVGGSASINKFGTLWRPTAISHDLDFEAYIGGASRRPWASIPDDPRKMNIAWYDRYVSPLERPGAVESSPILQRIREAFPETHAGARVVDWDPRLMKDTVDARYKTGVFQRLNDFPDVYPSLGGHQFVGTRINGIPVDLFLRDARISHVSGTPYAPPETAFRWKELYARENALRGLPPRAKDVQDAKMFKRFSRDNPIVDPVTGRAQFSPPNFGDTILTEEQLPAIHNVETWPGSGEAVPMLMNTKGEMLYPFDARIFRQDAKGGDTRAASEGGDGGSPEDTISPEPGEGASSFLPSAGGGPRIVINPTTFKNKKDALCVAFNEGFRLWMEANDFQPRSEPTDAQRKFFSDTAYADDELQLRRTILARIATFDTSVKDPTDDQLAETAEFLGAVLESDWCKNDWERDCVSRLAQAAQAAVGAEPVEARQEPLEAREAEPLQARAAMGGGETDDEEEDKAGQATPAQETESGMDLGYAMERMGGVTQQQQEEQEPEPEPEQQDVNGDGTVIGHSADYEAQLDSENQEDMAEANAEYEKLRQSGALDDPASFDNGGQTTGGGQARETATSPGLDAEKPASQGRKSEEESKETGSQETPRPGAIESGVVGEDSPGSLSYRGPRQGAIENDIVSKNSPGSLSYRGPRPGAIEGPIVNPASQGSIGFSGVRDGGIERPTVDPNSPGSLSYRRRRRKRR